MTANPAQDATPFYQKKLYKLLDGAFPRLRTVQGLFDVSAFATSIGMTPEGVYKWLRSERMSVDGAHKVIELSKHDSNVEITKEQLFPFVMG
jgi:hypothetical protein